MATEKGSMNEARIRTESDMPLAVPEPTPVPAAISSASVPEGSNSSEIRREIERTRAEMDSTFDELSERLSPRHILDDIIDIWQGGGDRSRGVRRTFRETGSRLADNVRDHPIPAALIGAGLAWLMFEDKKPRRRFRDEPASYGGSFVDARTGEPYDRSGYGAEWRDGRPLQMQKGNPLHPDFPEEEGTTGGAPGMMDKAKSALSGAGESMKDAVSGVRDKLGGMASSSRESFFGMSERFTERSDLAGRQMRSGFQRGTGMVERLLDEAPLAAGVAALAVGLAAGLLLPGTRREDELMGEASESLKDQVLATGSELAERAGQVAKRTGEAVVDEAGNQNLDRKLSSIADAARVTAESEVKRQKDEMGRGM